MNVVFSEQGESFVAKYGAPQPINGKSAYEIAVDNGFEGTEQEWLETLRGQDGVSVTHDWDGTSLIVTSASGTSSADLKGEKGEPGQDGKDGVSVEHSWNGTELTVTSASGTSSADLKGDKGDKGDKGNTGDSGVYVGSGDMPDGYNVQIDPDSEGETLDDIIAETLQKSGVDMNVLVYDYTFADESMIPTAYDATTGVFTVERIPDWVRVANAYYKAPGCCNTQYRLSIGANKADTLPPRGSMTYNPYFVEVVDDTHIRLCSNKELTTLVTLPSNLNVSLFTFERVDFSASFDMSAWKKFRIEGHDVPISLGYYDATISSQLLTAASAMGYINSGNALTGSFTQELEWVDDTKMSLKGWQESMCLVRNSKDFKANTIPKMYSYSNKGVRAKGIISIGGIVNSVIKNGSNIKIYGLEPWPNKEG